MMKMVKSLMLVSKLAADEVLMISINGQTAARSSLFSRAFVTAAPRPLQGKKEAEQCQNVKEAADAVKDGAKQVKETTEFIRDVAASSAESVKKMTKEVTEKVSQAADTVTEKTKGSVSGAWGTAKAATEMIKDKISRD